MIIRINFKFKSKKNRKNECSLKQIEKNYEKMRKMRKNFHEKVL